MLLALEACGFDSAVERPPAVGNGAPSDAGQKGRPEPPLVCKPGYAPGEGSCRDIDECELGTHDCDDFATCVNSEGGFECRCATGYKGDGVHCEDIDECERTRNPCGRARCYNHPGSYSCGDCDAGFGPNAQGACVDIDECARGTDHCDVHATCVNKEGGYTCSCAAGYGGNGTSCADVDECTEVTPPPCDTDPPACENLTPEAGGFRCNCPNGYAGDGVGPDGCTDINECKAGVAPCDTMPAAACTNTDGGFECACPNGYQGTGIGELGCQDIDECAGGSHGCDVRAICNNTEGGYACSCTAGFKGDGRKCVDIDECGEVKPPPCDTQPVAQCNNTEGTFECLCPPGYVGTGQGEDGCADLDECAIDNGGCDTLTVCTNNPGAAPTCGACPAPYLDLGGGVCQPTLLGLELADGVLSPAFDPAVVDYHVDLRLLVEATSVTPTAPEGADIEVDGTRVHSGTPSAPIMLNLGETSVRVSVARAGRAATEYTLHFVRGQLEAYIKASNVDPEDRFGSSVALSGNTLAVGAWGEASASTGIGGDQHDNSAGSSGAVYVFERTEGQWRQQAYIKSDRSAPSGLFGYSVAIWGDTLAVGARHEEAFNGAVYIYHRAGGSWSKQARVAGVGGSHFGFSLALHRDTLAVGAFAGSGSGSGVDPPYPGPGQRRPQSGAVYVYERVEGSWGQEAYIKASNPGREDFFGWSVALWGDTLAVGTPYEDSSSTGVGGEQTNNLAANSGAVYVFERTEDGWSQQAYIKASNTDPGDWFGRQVALDGDTLVVGSEREDSAARGIGGDEGNNSAEDSGAIYVFERTGSAWSQGAFIKSSNSDAGDIFGNSVAILGDTLAVGARREQSAARGVQGDEDDNSLGSGAAYLFERVGASWRQWAYVKASNTDYGDGFGYHLALSQDTLVVTAIGERSGATGVGGDQADNSTFLAGAAYVY